MVVPKPRVLFLALTNDVGANRVVAAMAATGLETAVVSPPGFYSARVSANSRHFPLPKQRGFWLAMLSVARRLEKAVAEWRPDWVIPLDDMASWQLRSLALAPGTSPALCKVITTSLGDVAGYNAAVSRAELLRVAAELGVRVPQSLPVFSIADAQVCAAQIGYPLMLKFEHTCGGAGVVPIATPEALAVAMRAAGLGSHRDFKRLRTAAKLFVWRRAGLKGLDAPPAGLQAMVTGQLAMRTVAAVGGRVLAGVNFAALHVHPQPTGASTVIRPIEHPEMERATAKIVAQLGASGFLSFDFLLSHEDSGAFLIEMNGRPVGSVHLGARIGHDVCGALAAYISGRPIAARHHTLVPDLKIALFPKELERDPSSAYLRPSPGILHDVPWDDPLVVAAYMEWLRRVHPDRIGEIECLLARAPTPKPAEAQVTPKAYSRLRA
jgi:biotin carboxylase